MPLRVLVTAYDISPVESRGSFRSWATDSWNLVDQLSRFCNVSVLTQSGNHEDILESLSQGALPQVNFHFVDPPQNWMSRFQGHAGAHDVPFYLWERRAFQTARALHQEKAFDAVHHLSPGFSSTPPLLSSALPIPSLWGPVTPEIKPPRNGVGARRSLPDRLGGGLSRILQMGHRRYPKDGVVLLSDSAPEIVNNFPSGARDKFFLFPIGGISKSRMVKAASLSESRGEFLVLAAGDFNFADGYLMLLQAFFEFSREHRNAELAVVGRGWQDERIGRLMRELSLGSRIELWDWIPRSDLQEKLAQADVFIAPDFDAHTASLCVDAMAAGVPVVTFQGSGAHIFVEEGWGIQIRWEDPRQIIGDLKEALDALADSSVMRRRMGRAALRNVRENLVWEKQGEMLNSMYSQTLLQEESIRIEHTGKGRFFY
jgi:glycosyltransferase involved in cell wall biosynthesis